MDNKLTTKEAITVLRNLQDWLYFSAMNGGTSIQREAIDMAISALEQPEIIHCIDCQHSEYDSVYGDRWCHYNGKAEVVDDYHFCRDGEKKEVTT